MRRPAVLFVVGLLLLAAAAFAIRVPRLSERPMHGDEANQALKAGLLLETGVYRYDPSDHHGPILYWLTLPSLWLSGVQDFAHGSESSYRIVPVVFGAGLILLLFLVADGSGRPAAVAAGVLMTISPALVFYSRYYVQETLLVFFTLAAIGSAWRSVRTGSVGWATVAGACFGLMHATKETWIIAAAAMGIGGALAIAWTRFRDGALPPWRPCLRWRSLAAAAIAAGVVAVCVYSALGRDWRAPLESVRAYASYWQRGRGAGEAGMHAHPWYYYLQLLIAYRPAPGFFWSEGLIVGLAAVGCAASLAASRGPASPRPGFASRRAATTWMGSGADVGFCRFLAFYTVVLTALYAVITYKTPWCLLSFLTAMILMAGIGVQAVLRSLPGWPAKAFAALLLLAAAAHLGRECYQLNFRFFADYRNPYVYAHASRDVLDLARQMERLAQASPDGHQLVVHVVTPENYWPLPWYLRRFNRDHIGYWQDVAAWRDDTRQYPPPPVIMLAAEIQAEVDANLRAGYNQQMMYGLRPGVLLKVYVREDLWQAFTAAAARPGEQ